MGLKPLEYSDCYLDSPYFRDNVYEHEKELERTSERIKGLIKECKNLLRAVDNLSKAQNSFCSVLKDFTLNYIGEIDTPDEIEIADAFTNFATLIERVEEERARMLEHAHVQLIGPLEKFRKVQIAAAKDEKKKYDDETRKFCALQDKHFQLKNKTKEELLRESTGRFGLLKVIAPSFFDGFSRERWQTLIEHLKSNVMEKSDTQLINEFKTFQKLGFDYVSKLQEVNETKKFELVEILLTYMYGQKTFFHNGHECYTDAKIFLDSLAYQLQTIRERYNVTKEEAEDLKRKVEKQGEAGDLQRGSCARQGYLYVQERKHGGLVSAWTKHYCTYQKENKILTMIPFTQTMGKMNTNTDTMVVTSCVRKATDLTERRFCFDITGLERKEPIQLQALSEEDRRHWLDVMDGQEPIYLSSSDVLNDADTITEIGLVFVKKCISAVEKKSLDEEGLYRVAGVSSKFSNLVKTAIEMKKAPMLDLESDQSEYDLRTITSALKQYFRDLIEPILTYKLHNEFLDAIKLETPEKRLENIRSCVCRLPEKNYSTLKLLMQHLVKVAAHSSKNLMQASNIGVVWGPTLMRPRQESMAALMNLKFQGVVVETLITDFEKIFADDAGRKPKKDLPPPEKPEMRRSPNLQRKVQNGPIGISNPGYIDVKPQVLQKPVPSQKSYPAPPPPGNKPVLPKKKPAKITEDEELEGWEVVSERSSGYSSTASSVAEEHLHRTVSTPNVSTVPEVNLKPTYSPKNRRSTEGTKPDPPPKRFLESVPGFTSVQKIDDTEESSDVDYENLSSAQPKRSVSFEKAVQRGKVAMIKPLPAEKKPTSPPPIPRRHDWLRCVVFHGIAEPFAKCFHLNLHWSQQFVRKVRAVYNCVGEYESELSFGIGAIITNVRKSTEEGWLTGTLNGRTGLVPVNYVETIEEG